MSSFSFELFVELDFFLVCHEDDEMIRCLVVRVHVKKNTTTCVKRSWRSQMFRNFWVEVNASGAVML